MLKAPVFSFKRKLIGNTNNIIHLPMDIIKSLGFAKNASINIGLEQGENNRKFIVIWEDTEEPEQTFEQEVNAETLQVDAKFQMEKLAAEDEPEIKKAVREAYEAEVADEEELILPDEEELDEIRENIN